MFVRFRQSRNRLQASLIETRRVAGKVRHEHVASLGAVDSPPSIRERLTFWGKLPDRLGRLANRINAGDQAKIYGAVHARIPMVTPDEQRSLQEESAKADERFWSVMRDMNAEAVEGQKGVIDLAERAVAEGQAGIALAEVGGARAKERLDRLGRGEAVSGGFDKPKTLEAILIEEGWSKSDLRHARRLNAAIKACGIETVLKEIRKRTDRAEKSVARDLAILATIDEPDAD
jgi:hypothetical protein